MNAMRGIIIGVLASIPLWAAIIIAIRAWS